MTDLAVFLRGKEELSFPRSPWREVIVTYRSGSRRIDLDHPLVLANGEVYV